MPTHLHLPAEQNDHEGTQSAFIHVHMLSDSTGETVSSLAKACLAQFDHIAYQEHVWTMIRNEDSLQYAIDEIKANPGIILYTLVDPNIRKRLQQFCHEQRLPSCSIMDYCLDIFTQYLGKPGRWQPGKQHQLDSDYFDRIDAMQYSLMHDDGLGEEGIRQADILLLGISRTSKTPTSIYLANRGYKTANIPIVPGNNLPEWVMDLKPEAKPLVVCLVRDAVSLVEIRKSRLKLIDPDFVSSNNTNALGGNQNYIDPDQVKKEVTASRRLAAQQQWQLIDVTRRSIEEAAAIIISLYEEQFS